MASKQLVVKAALQYPEGLELGCSPDIRRFKLARENADDKRDLYCRLVDTLSTVFPDILGIDHSLFWKDGEGELVEFSTLGELQAALDAMSDHVLRIYVIVHFDDIEETTETEGQSDPEKASKHVLFARAGRKFRRKVRRRRRTALSDPVVLSKEFRIGARVMIRRLHRTDKNGDEIEIPLQGSASLAEMAPEVQQFIQQIHEEWHSKLTTQRPTVVARRMRMKQRNLPPGLKKDHFLWLLRLMGRWHRRHATQCRAMSGWSSGDTDADESAGEEGEGEAMLRKIQKKKKKQRRDAKKGAKSAAKGADVVEKEEEEDPEQQTLTKEFRQAVRVLMKRIHKKKNPKSADDDQEKATLAALKPEVHSFLQKVADDWHAMLGEKKPRLVAKRMKKRKRTLPADLQREHYLWLCRYFRRWHARNASRCSDMAGWSSGEDGGDLSDDDDDDDDDNEDTSVKEKKKESSSSSSSSGSDSDVDKKKKKAVAKEFVKGTRVLVNRLHNRKGVPGNENSQEEETATLAALSPEIQTFIQNFAENWDKKLSTKSPIIVAKRMQRKERSLPPGTENKHVQFLCRFLTRWHSKHAAFCGAMGSWSSGETGGEGETDGGEERSSLRRRARLTGALDVSTASEQEDTDCVEMACKPVSKEFRTGVRQWLNQLHKPPPATDTAGSKKAKAKDDKEMTTLSPEVQQFLQRFADDWHSKLSCSRPRAVSREMKSLGKGVTLPSRMEREQYSWLCCFMARWHRKHAAKCDVMSGKEMAVGAQD
ncbi:hypothetical protein ACOMHN_051257 [Nucella lapillus]